MSSILNLKNPCFAFKEGLVFTDKNNKPVIVEKNSEDNHFITFDNVKFEEYFCLNNVSNIILKNKENLTQLFFKDIYLKTVKKHLFYILLFLNIYIFGILINFYMYLKNFKIKTKKKLY